VSWCQTTSQLESADLSSNVARNGKAASAEHVLREAEEARVSRDGSNGLVAHGVTYASAATGKPRTLELLRKNRNLRFAERCRNYGKSVGLDSTGKK